MEDLICNPSISSTEWTQLKGSTKVTEKPTVAKSSVKTTKKIEIKQSTELRKADTKAIEYSTGMMKSVGWVIAVPIIVWVLQ